MALNMGTWLLNGAPIIGKENRLHYSIIKGSIHRLTMLVIAIAMMSPGVVFAADPPV